MAIIKKNPYNDIPTESTCLVPKGSLITIGKIYEEARRLALATHPFDIESFLKRNYFEIMREDMDVDISGYIELRGVRWVIGVNKYHNPRRQRFTMAHEFGHYLFDYEEFSKKRHFDTILFRSAESSEIEARANKFAGQLLMPKDLFEGYILRGIKNIEELADKFDVSPAAVRYRAFNLGYIKQY